MFFLQIGVRAVLRPMVILSAYDEEDSKTSTDEGTKLHLALLAADKITSGKIHKPVTRADIPFDEFISCMKVAVGHDVQHRR